MERVLSAVPRSCCVVYLDDLLLHASNFEHNLANLCDVISAVRLAGSVKPKEVPASPEGDSLLGAHCKLPRTNPAKVAAVKDWAGTSERRRAMQLPGASQLLQALCKGLCISNPAQGGPHPVPCVSR